MMKRHPAIGHKVLGLWLLLMAFALSLGGGVASAQSPPDLWLVAHGDSVLILISEPPLLHRGFVVDRAEVGGEWERITPEPIRPLTQPTYLSTILGEAYDDVMADLQAGDDLTLLRRLQSDEFTAGVLSMVYPEVAEVLGRIHTDTGLREGARYEYRVTFVDHAGRERGESLQGRVQIADVEPGRPFGLEAEAGNHEVKLTWEYQLYSGSPTDYVLGFHLERATGDGEFERVTRRPVIRIESEPLRFHDYDLANDVVYRYRVRAVDLVGRQGAPSEEVRVTPIDDSAPSTPSQLVTEEGDGVVELTWRIAPEPNVVGYWVERSEGLEGPYRRIVSELVPTEMPILHDSTVRGGTQYFYRIVAVNDRGVESRPSNAISVVPYDRTPPEPVSGLEVEIESRQLQLRWAPSPSDDVVGYHIYRGDSADRLIRLTDRPHPVTEFIDRGYEGGGLAHGGRYVVQVVAVDHSENESEPVVLEVEVPDELPPDPAAGLLARDVLGRYVEVRWSPSPSLDVEHYELTRELMGLAVEVAASRGEDEWVALGDFAADSGLEVRDTLVEPGSRYRYHLVSVDSAGNRSETAMVEVEFRTAAPPLAPRQLRATVVDDGVTVSWGRVASSALVGYRVYRAQLPTGVFEPVSELITDERVFIDRGGREGYFYRVHAVDISGRESRPSTAVRAERR